MEYRTVESFVKIYYDDYCAHAIESDNGTLPCTKCMVCSEPFRCRGSDIIDYSYAQMVYFGVSSRPEIVEKYSDVLKIEPNVGVTCNIITKIISDEPQPTRQELECLRLMKKWGCYLFVGDTIDMVRDIHSDLEKQLHFVNLLQAKKFIYECVASSCIRVIKMTKVLFDIKKITANISSVHDITENTIDNLTHVIKSHIDVILEN